MFLSSGFGPMADEANWERDSPPAVAGGDGEGRHGFVLAPRPIESEEGPPKRKEEPEVKPPENMQPRSERAMKLPQRVKDVLEASEDFGKYREKRVFKYLHLFSGPNDNLKTALEKECNKAGLLVEVESVDVKIDKSHDLRDPSKWMQWSNKIEEGEYDGTHSGFPCTTFSVLRWREAEGQPRPVRSAKFPYGLPGNSEQQQREADQGTLYATWSSKLLGKQSISMKERGVPEVCTAENPPGSEEKYECPAWELPEVKAELQKANANFVEFHTCAYMSKEKVRFYKPAKWGGRLEGMRSLSRVCRCPSWVQHKPVIGKAASTAAGVYPEELCEAIAKLLVATWKRILNLEFWRYRCERARDKVSAMQQKWLENEEKRVNKTKRERVVLTIPAEKFGPGFDASDLEHKGPPKASVGDSKKEYKAKEDEVYLGGMRNPRKAVERLWKMRDAGGKVRRAWEEMVKRNPGFLELGHRYGAEDAGYDETLADLWKDKFSELVRLDGGEGITFHDNWMFKSPVDGDLWDSWCRFAGDPEHCLGNWAVNGAPLGMNETIQTSNNIFPPARGKDALDDQLPEIEAQVDVANYRSFLDQPEDAELEVKRLVEAGFAIVVEKEDARKRFGKGTVSRLALIVKEKPDGSRKRRVIVDMLRSGGNARATCPERIVLPRIADVTEMTRNMFRRCEEKVDQGKAVRERRK